MNIEPKPVCEICNDTSWVTHGDGPSAVTARCGCFATGIRARRTAAAKIPLRHDHSTFASYKPRNESGRAARSACEKFAEFWPDREGLLIMGPAGVGKTHLGIATLREVVNSGASGLFCDWRLFLQDIKASFEDPEMSESDLINPVIQVDLLVLDDLAAGRMSEWAAEVLQVVIASRYNECATTIITTNYREDLVDRIGTRVRSRLAEMCQPVTIVGEDYRLKERRDQC